MKHKKNFGKVNFSDIKNMERDDVNYVLSMLENVNDFDNVSKESGVAYATYKDSHGRDKIKGIWADGQNKSLVSFSAAFQSHVWRDDQIKDLLSGKDVSVEIKDSEGKPARVEGKLNRQSYMGNGYVGFTINKPEQQKTVPTKHPAVEIVYDEPAMDMDDEMSI